MALKHVQKTYDALGAQDPLYAVLSFPEAKGNRWDPEVFFGRGKAEIDGVMAGLADRNLPATKGRALDFGCGVGRLTQALAGHFDAVDGVDISASMVSKAREFNQHGERCNYHVNTVAELSLFADETFDFIYSNITLQHIPPEASEAYIGEFIRVLKPGGTVLFQVPDGPLIRPGTVGDAWYRFRSGTLRRAWKRLRGKAPVEIHHIHHSRVETLIAQAGGELLDSWQEGSVRRRRVSRFYLALALSLVMTAGSAIAGDAPLGTSWPGSKPELFAPGVVNTDGVEINLVFNQDYSELFFARAVDQAFFIYTSRLIDGAWTEPEQLQLYPADTPGEAVDMALSPDEQSLYFLGITPEGDAMQTDIWVSERNANGWSLAQRLGPAVNTRFSEFYPTVVADGSLFFVSDRPSELGSSNLFRAARKADGSFEPAVPTGPPIDSALGKGDTYVSPDEDYMIFSSRDREGFGAGDLFIAYRMTEGGWTEPKNMGSLINGGAHEFCPMVSADGKWLSFSRRYGDSWADTTRAEVYWMDTSVIEALRNQ